MAGALDATARALATNLLERFGDTGVVTFVDNGVETEDACFCLLDYDTDRTTGVGGRDDSILDSDLFYFMDAASLARMPVLGDRFTVDGTTYAVILAKPVKGRLPIMYRVQVRA